MPEGLLDRVPPQNPEAEAAVLGSMMLDGSVVFEVLDEVDEHDFYHSRNRVVFDAIRHASLDGQNPDMLVVADLLEKSGRLGEIGGQGYLHELISSVPSAAGARRYARIVREKALLRGLITACGKVIEMAYVSPGEADELLDEASHLVFEATRGRATGKVTRVSDLLEDAIGELEKLSREGGVLRGLQTGYYELDALLGGLRKGELVILAGRPSSGKTSFALNMMLRLNRANDVPVLFFSIEMSREQIAENMLSMESEVSFHKGREGTFIDPDGDEWERITSAAGLLADKPVLIDDSGSLHVVQLRQKARRLLHSENIRLIVVDYIQLLRGPKTENRQQEMTHISGALKSLAKDLNVPVVALSQLSRAVEQRQNKRPILSDLRESGAIEQDADKVVFVHRPEQYDQSAEQGIAYLIVAKNRNGPTDEVKLAFKKKCMRFENFHPEDEPVTLGARRMRKK